ncbi:MAG TPA: hypothetical protein VIM61_12665 [Chthoniobacterales bacterium]|jgi:hypothetical protein
MNDACHHKSAPGASSRLIRAIAETKARLRARYEKLFPGRESHIEAILELAESAAWCTPFPHLFLPDLAEVQIAGLSPVPAA